MQAPLPLPWYKEPWPWILIGITGLGVVAGSTLAFIGLSSPPEIVRGEYQRLAKFITEQDDRATAAQALGLAGRLELIIDEVVLTLAADNPDGLPAQLMIQFRHPATSEGDRVVVVDHRGRGDYRGRVPDPPVARSHVIVSDLAQSWVLSGRLDGDLGKAIVVEARLP
ncbi:MAG: FixH family protein [Wenzhouxiangella sp.]|jgi:hypothetical protein|nr:FixH family protein [Wenzhouxiangella sp.]